MNLHWDQIKGDWHQLSRKLQEKWKLLTDAELKSIAGRRAQLEDVLSNRYSYGKAQATVELDKFTDRLTS